MTMMNLNLLNDVKFKKFSYSVIIIPIKYSLKLYMVQVTTRVTGHLKISLLSACYSKWNKWHTRILWPAKSNLITYRKDCYVVNKTRPYNV